MINTFGKPTGYGHYRARSVWNVTSQPQMETDPVQMTIKGKDGSSRNLNIVACFRPSSHLLGIGSSNGYLSVDEVEVNGTIDGNYYTMRALKFLFGRQDHLIAFLDRISQPAYLNAYYNTPAMTTSIIFERHAYTTHTGEYGEYTDVKLDGQSLFTIGSGPAAQIGEDVISETGFIQANLFEVATIGDVHVLLPTFMVDYTDYVSTEASLVAYFSTDMQEWTEQAITATPEKALLLFATGALQFGAFSYPATTPQPMEVRYQYLGTDSTLKAAATLLKQETNSEGDGFVKL